MNKIIKAVVNIITFLVIGFTVLNFGAERIGYKSFEILSDSMLPKYRTGDVVITKPVESLEAGDIIAFKSNSINVVHRVYSIDNDGITTKGDNNKDVDFEKTQMENVLGQVIYCLGSLSGLYLLFIKYRVKLIIGLIALNILVELPDKKVKQGGDANESQ